MSEMTKSLLSIRRDMYDVLTKLTEYDLLSLDIKLGKTNSMVAIKNLRTHISFLIGKLRKKGVFTNQRAISQRKQTPASDVMIYRQFDCARYIHK